MSKVGVLLPRTVGSVNRFVRASVAAFTFRRRTAKIVNACDADPISRAGDEEARRASRSSLDPCLRKRQERAAALRRSSHLGKWSSHYSFPVDRDFGVFRGNEQRGHAKRVPRTSDRRIELERRVEIFPDQFDFILLGRQTFLPFPAGISSPPRERRLDPWKRIFDIRLVERAENLLGEIVEQRLAVGEGGPNVIRRLAVSADVAGDEADVTR